MSLFRPERRAITSTVFLDPSAIPSNSDTVFSPVLASGQGALRHWAVWACARVVSNAVSMLPVDIMHGTGANATPVDVLPAILQRPSPYLNRVDWLQQVMVSLLTTGNVYGLVGARDYYEYPTQINLVAPGTITASIDAEGRKVYKTAGGKKLSAEQVWHHTGLTWPGDVVGLDPVTYFVRTITLGLSAEKYGADYYEHGAHPTAVASTEQPVDQAQAETIKSRIKKAVAGRDIAVLGAGIKLEAWQGSPNDAQLAETIRMNAAMVCAIYGVPPEKIGVSMGDGGSVTYANREQRRQDFLDDAVNPWLVGLQDSMSLWFPRGRFVKFNTGGFSMSDTKTQAEYFKTATGGKAWMEPSEARALMNMAPLPGIDDQQAPGPQNGGDDVPQG